jgi:hypothetical protein
LGAVLFGTDRKRGPVRRIKLSELQRQKQAKALREGKVWGAGR